MWRPIVGDGSLGGGQDEYGGRDRGTVERDDTLRGGGADAVTDFADNSDRSDLTACGFADFGARC